MGKSENESVTDKLGWEPEAVKLCICGRRPPTKGQTASQTDRQPEAGLHDRPTVGWRLTGGLGSQGWRRWAEDEAVVFRQTWYLGKRTETWPPSSPCMTRVVWPFLSLELARQAKGRQLCGLQAALQLLVLSARISIPSILLHLLDFIDYIIGKAFTMSVVSDNLEKRTDCP